MGNVLPRALMKGLQEGTLSHTDSGVYVHIARLASEQDGRLITTIGELTVTLSMSKTNLIQTVRRLCDHGLLVYRPAESRYTKSELLLPETADRNMYRFNHSTAKAKKRRSGTQNEPMNESSGMLTVPQNLVESVDKAVDSPAQKVHRSNERTATDEIAHKKDLRDKTFSTSEPPMRLAQLLLTKMQTIDPKAKGNLNRWADSIDKLNRIDERDFEDIEFVIDWLYTDDRDAVFWRPNVHSGDALRRHFTKIVLKLNGRRPRRKDDRPTCHVCEGRGWVLREDADEAVPCPAACDGGRVTA